MNYTTLILLNTVFLVWAIVATVLALVYAASVRELEKAYKDVRLEQEKSKKEQGSIILSDSTGRGHRVPYII